MRRFLGLVFLLSVWFSTARGQGLLLRCYAGFELSRACITERGLDPKVDKLKILIKAGKPMIFFHNHPAEKGRMAMFPSYDDFGVTGLFSFLAYAEKPDLAVEFRVVQLGDHSSIVSYQQAPLDAFPRPA